MSTSFDLHNEAIRLFQKRDWLGALVKVEQALIVASLAAPLQAQLYITRAHCLLALGRRCEARVAAMMAESQSPVSGPIADAAGSIYSACGDQQLALEAYQRAVKRSPAEARFIFNRATVNRFLGNLESAEADYDKVIALHPGDFEAYKNRSDLRLQTLERNHIVELQNLLARRSIEWRGEVLIRYALAKEHEDLGQYATSFGQLKIAAQTRRRHLSYDVRNDVATVDWIIDAFPSEPTLSEKPSSLAAPLFIVGLPRSGTTLVERVLSCHPGVQSAGELDDFALALADAVQADTPGGRLSRHDMVARSASVNFSALGHEYLRRARAVVPGTGLFIDKMPLNYLYCGLISKALPAAKIIHVTRHPVATGYALYKTLFKDAYPFSYDLTEIGHYYVAYRRLMQHWTRILPGRIYEINYESLIDNQAGESRKLLEFCGLEWNDACLHFHLNAEPTTTASASQVRRPLYSASVAQWRHYSKELEPLIRHLSSAGVNV